MTMLIGFYYVGSQAP